jgi:hypothetical protein
MNKFLFQTESDENAEDVSFSIIPNNLRDAVYSVDVIDHSKINFFNTYNNILT